MTTQSLNAFLQDRYIHKSKPEDMVKVAQAFAAYLAPQGIDLQDATVKNLQDFTSYLITYKHNDPTYLAALGNYYKNHNRLDMYHEIGHMFVNSGAIDTIKRRTITYAGQSKMS